MSLPADYARCNGAELQAPGFWAIKNECIKCLRRKSPGLGLGNDQWQKTIAPHDGDGPCPSRIGPREGE